MCAKELIVECGCSEVADLKDVYEKQIRSILEFGAAVFTANLTVADANDIERVQKTAAHIILADNYTTYKDALEVLCLETLKDRRLQICTNFALKAYNHPKFCSWFVKSDPIDHTLDRNCKPAVEETFLKPVKARTKRFRKSPIAFLTNLINVAKK